MGVIHQTATGCRHVVVMKTSTQSILSRERRRRENFDMKGHFKFEAPRLLYVCLLDNSPGDGSSCWVKDRWDRREGQQQSWGTPEF